MTNDGGGVVGESTFVRHFQTLTQDEVKSRRHQDSEGEEGQQHSLLPKCSLENGKLLPRVANPSLQQNPMPLVYA